MSISNLVFGSILTLIGGVSAVQTLRLIFTPLKKTAVAEGDSTILGTVIAEKSILSPITKTPCVYCVYRTFERGGSFGSRSALPKSKPRGVAQVVAGSGVKQTPFFLEDDSGRILVQDKAQLFGEPKKQITVYDNTSGQSDNIREFKTTTGIGEGVDRQYEEDLIEAGDKIYVHGIIKVENGQKVMYPDALSFKSTRKVGLSPVGIIVTIVLLILGINLLVHAF